MKQVRFLLVVLSAFMFAACDIIFNHNMDESYMIMGTVYKGNGNEPLANCTVFAEIDYGQYSSKVPLNRGYDLNETVTDENGRFAFAYKQEYRDYQVGDSNAFFYVKNFNLLEPVYPKWNYHMKDVELRVHGADVAFLIHASEPVQDTIFFGLPNRVLSSTGNQRPANRYVATSTLYAAPEDFENGRCTLNLTLTNYRGGNTNPFCFYGVGREDFYRSIAFDTSGGAVPDTSQSLSGNFIGFPLKDTLRLNL